MENITRSEKLDVAVEWRYGLSQSFPWPGTLAAEERSARSRVSAVATQANLAALSREFSAQELFLRLVRTAKMIEVQKSSLKVVDSIRVFVHEKFKQGSGSHMEFLQAHSESGLLRANLAALTTYLENLKRHALLLMNDPGFRNPGSIDFDLEWPHQLIEQKVIHAEIIKAGKPKRDIVIRAPISGTILDISAREGAAVAQGQAVYTIGDLSKTYIVARVFQQDVSGIKLGQKAEIKIPGENRKLNGSVNLIYPQVEGAGTTNVRVEVTEYVPGMRPGVYVDALFPMDLGQRLAIPTEAVLYSGRHRYVFIDRGEGVLEPREVEVGKSADQMVEVREGLKEGERVAASGTFLLGAEAQLRSALPKWQGSRTQATHQTPESAAPESGPAPKQEGAGE